MLKIYKALAILLGYGLIITCFILFGASLETSVLILDIIVSLLIFTQFALFFILPLINLNDASHKEVGMMGLHFYSLYICVPASLLLMFLGIVFGIPFSFQLIGQLLILFLLLIGRVATLGAGRKVSGVYHKEQNIKSGKELLRRNLDDFVDYISGIRGIDPNIVDRVQVIKESIRFISPSANAEAKHFDAEIVDIIQDLKILMRDTIANREKILDELSRLERTLNRRKRY